VFSEFTDSGYWLPAYEAQDRAMDAYMEKYGLEDQDWRPGMKQMMKKFSEQED
jgi:hypothetical protein